MVFLLLLNATQLYSEYKRAELITDFTVARKPKVKL